MIAKKRLFPLLLCLAAVLLCIAAGAERQPGFYESGSAAGLAVTPDGILTPDAEKESFYAGSGMLSVTISPTQAGCSYLVLLAEGEALPTAETPIAYVNVAVADGGELTMPVRPILRSSAEFRLYVTSGQAQFATKTVPLKYYAPLRLGDADADGEITAADAALVLRHYVDSEAAQMTAEQREVADINGDGAVNVVDASMLLQHCVSACDSSVCPLDEEA